MKSIFSLLALSSIFAGAFAAPAAHGGDLASPLSAMARSLPVAAVPERRAYAAKAPASAPKPAAKTYPQSKQEVIERFQTTYTTVKSHTHKISEFRARSSPGRTSWC